MTAGGDVLANVAACASLVAQAGDAGAALLLLPECFAFVGASDDDTSKMAEPLDGALFDRYRGVARDAGLWVCFGGFPEKIDGTHHHNAHVVVDGTGAIRAVYRKIHLFDVTLPNGAIYQESRHTSAGDRLVVVDSPVGKLGLSVCYDLRFPELYRALAEQGAEVLLVPAAFTLTTGKEHWEPLLRARAIENACWVVAAAQTGRHNERRDTYGHAMAIDPWGTVVAQCRDGTGIATCTIDRAWQDEVRRRIPVWQHRRPDAYRGVV
ncbi:MAG: carbon-nitrogen hydrolase family protein [Deltaproteobacteria bacterium]|nr:carbon-nitrogen hydrolase family protein [Deltaproteobacteria bacterium]